MTGRTWIKTVAGVFAITGICTVILAQGGLAGLGVREPEARSEAVYAVTRGYVPVHLAAKAFKAAPAGGRAALVTAALEWVKAYLSSPSFKAEYERRRKEAAPAPPQTKGTVDEEIAKQRAEQRKGVEDARKSLAAMNPEMRKQMEVTIRQMEEQINKMEQDQKMTQMMRQGLEMQRESEREAHKERVTKYEASYPVDPSVLVARRLREFLDLSKDVDFGARLVAAPGGKMRFVNPAYEAKPQNWKLCFRAGRDVVGAARTFAADWLKQLGQ
jgi:hypothetical protein